MRVDRVYGVICVRTIEVALEFYAQVFGREPDARPMESLGEWYPVQGGGIQVFEEAERAGTSYATLNVPDITELVSELESRGLSVDKSGIDFDPFRLASVTDPDGNRVTFAQDTRA